MSREPDRPAPTSTEPAAPARGGEYAASYLGHTVHTEHARLRALEAAFDPSTIDVLSHLSLPPIARCLELGAGAGSIANWLLGHCPDGYVTATDIDTRFLTPSPPRFRVLRHDVVHDELPESSFDVIHARALLSHLRDRDRLLRRAATWLRPGGWLVVEDLSIHPVDDSPHPLLKKITSAGAELLATTVGTDLRWVFSVSHQMHGLGLQSLGFRITPGTIGDGSATDQFWKATFDQAVPSLVDGGFVCKQDIADMYSLHQSPHFTDTALALVSAWGRRPS